MNLRRTGIAAGTLAAAAAVAFGGATLAQAATSTPSISPSASSSQSGSQHGAAAATSSDTAVTGAEGDKVIAAVKKTDAAATITTVRQDADGSYDALGTSNGSTVFYDVSADLATVTAGGGHGGRGGGPGGGGRDTAVAGAEADKVIAAVKKTDAAATITTVRQDADGSYDALGTSNGSPVFYDVSADLATVTAGGGHGGHGPDVATTPAG